MTPSLSPKNVSQIVSNHAAHLAYNHQLLDIYDDNLCGYIAEDLKAQLSEDSFKQAMFRASPINVLPKVIDKLTTIYQTAVVREVDGSTNDKTVFQWFDQAMRPNAPLNTANEMYNLASATLIYPCLRAGKPHLEVIENDRFIPYAADPMAPTTPTHIIILAGEEGDEATGGRVAIYWVWSKDEFYICDSKERLRTDHMEKLGNHQGVNPVGRLPFVYANKSKRKILPKQDTDMIRIVKLIPIMLTDLNLAAMYQSFSILYGIDLDEENIKMGPNQFWRLKSDAQKPEAKPQIGTIKPQVDFEQVQGLIQAQLSMWLATKGIRAGTVGGLTADNYASGISKIIDDMDTFEARQKQVTTFLDVESELWDLVLNHMYPYWLSRPGFEGPKLQWSADAKVNVSFSVQLPLHSRGQIVKDVVEEHKAGFTTRKRSIAKLNPELSTEQVDELIKEIELERAQDGVGTTEDQPENPGEPDQDAAA